MLVGKAPFCDFQTIQSAIDFSEKQSNEAEWITMTILEGIYEEQVTVSRSKLKIIGIGSVVITHDASATQVDSNGQPLGTFRTATFYLDGSDLHLENLTIENSAGQGEDVGQALAIYANCDKSTFKNCHFKGYQDTLFCAGLPETQKDGSTFQQMRPQHASYRQVYSKCTIEGTVDFIFGGASAYFEQCIIKSRKRKTNKDSYITAACTPEDQQIGFVFQSCYLIAEPGCNQVYLGRPWRPYAKVCFQACYLSDHIHPDRWDDWGKQKNRETAQFLEYGTIQAEPILNKESWYTYKSALEENLKLADVFENPFYERVKEKGTE
ncbi:pectinesterase family protein [Marinilactibacillus kalidii]|uniref:pectinesterase family protein n=1 Tax=Marinilactibacillus kalidii TaxID=2820274 RepID=UPI001ABE4D68|nr:pectinesterase family protein [Marinilactibacillus kalidii]